MEKIEFRFAEEKDTALILDFITALADYEKMKDQVVATEGLLREWLFEKKTAEVIFIMEDKKEAGFALFFHNFSTFLGRAGIYLEDLFVRPEFRGKGYGKNRGLSRIDLSATKDGYPVYKKAGFEELNSHYTEMRMRF